MSGITTRPHVGLLSTYIESVYGRMPLGAPIFDHGLTHVAPKLRKHTVNKILIYPGSFNPPHRGHLELLTHVFRHRDDVTAAIVLLRDDDDIRKKCRAMGDNLLFTKQERVSLWKGLGPSDWLWVFDRSVEDWYFFRRDLSRATAEDGFSLDFVLLGGPDQINPNCVIPWGTWGCMEFVVSDVSRPADFVTGSGDLKELQDCGTWRVCPVDRKLQEEKARKQVAQILGKMSIINPKWLYETLKNDPSFPERQYEELLKDQNDHQAPSMMCHSLKYPNGLIHYISAGRCASFRTQTSSTYIRRIIQNYGITGLEEELQDLVLSPTIMGPQVQSAISRGTRSNSFH